jgi:hypothetical protein
VQAQSHRRCCRYPNRPGVGLAGVGRAAQAVELGQQRAQAVRLAEVQAPRRSLRCLTATRDLAAATAPRCAGVRLRRAEVLGRLLCVACRPNLGLGRALHRRRGFVSPGVEAWPARWKAFCGVWKI